MERKTNKVLGYNVDLLSFNEASEFVTQKFQNNEGLHIVTINPEMIELAQKNTDFSDIIKNSELVIPDGSGIVMALKLKGIIQDRIPGIDFSKELIRICQTYNYPIALIGAKENVIQTTVKRLQGEFKQLNIEYYHNGYFSSEKEKEIIKELMNANPKLVLVALGAPKQELFIKKCKKLMPKTVFIGVGGSFDVWAGEVERAPEFFRVMGWEWIFRTYKQPERIKRIYKTLPAFLIKVIIEAITKKG